MVGDDRNRRVALTTVSLDRGPADRRIGVPGVLVTDPGRRHAVALADWARGAAANQRQRPRCAWSVQEAVSMSVSQFSPLDSWRQPGCSDKCWRKPVLIIGDRQKTLLEWHDLPSHRLHFRRTAEAVPDILEIGPLRIDRRTVSVELAGAPLYVTPTEYSLLLTLAERAGSVVEYQSVLERVWRGWLTGTEADIHTLRANVSRLRERLGTSAWLVSTRVGFGYWMPTVAPPGALPPEPAPPERQHPPQIDRRHRPFPLGRRQQTLLTLLRRTPEHRVSVALAAVHAYGRSTSETRSAIRQAARKTQRNSLVVRECWGPLPKGGSIWIEDGAS
jgi:hypothetical protein